ncbi:MAG: DNA repair protein RecO [Pseudomonadota bacterium]
MAAIQNQPAWVLHARPFRESSQLLELLTRDYGRVGAVARGARGTRSRWRGMLQPFRPLLVSYTRRSDLGTLTGAEQVAAPPALVGEALYCGLYVNELTLRLLMRHDPQPEAFEQYRATVMDLAAGSDVQPVLRHFEKQLLDATGFGLILDREAGGSNVINPEARYDYQPERGPVRVATHAPERPGIVRGSALLALDAGELALEDRVPVRHMMRRVIRHHLGEKPLASEALYRAMRTGRPAGSAGGADKEKHD